MHNARTVSFCSNVGSAKALPCFTPALRVVRHWRFSAVTSSLYFKSHSHPSARKARLGSPLLGVRTNSSRRFLREKHGAQYRTFSEIALSRLPAIGDAGVDVACKFVKDEEVLDKVEWDREKGLDSLAQELVELYEELQGALSASDESCAPRVEGRRVQYLSHGVYIQHNVYGLDRDGIEDSPCTITREESRSCVHHALDALQNRFAVAVTGQPGIGKTRGSMVYAIQSLLHQRAAVLYVGYKREEMLLFLPKKDGMYRVWTASSSEYGHTRLIRDERVVAVIDPPEIGPYSSRGRCRLLKFVSNNAEEHFRNWEKDGILLVTSMPCATEVVAMTQFLWAEEKTPHRWQHGEELNTLQGGMQEIKKRIDLVGPIPRLIFSSRLFRNAIKNCRLGATAAAADLSDSDYYMALRARYSPLLDKHPASASGRIFFLNPHVE